MKALYQAYDHDDVAMEDFAGVMLDDLYRVETTFDKNLWVYKLLQSDEVRQDAHVVVILRLYQQVIGAPSVPVLRGGHGIGLFLALAGESVDALVTPELRDVLTNCRAEA